MSDSQRYTLRETLFINAQTEVYRAVRERDQLSVIIRTFSESEPSAESDRATSNNGSNATSSRYSKLAFTREVLNQLDHPNIIKVVDWIDDKLCPQLILEDIKGTDLWRFAEGFEQKQLPVKLFLELATQLADALSVIHHTQIIHKDLHPGNIVVGYDEAHRPRAQIIDFGLASLLSREQPALSPPDKLEGVLAYISPEQTGRMNRALDYRSDFYTLGATFYQLLSGEQPFVADDALGMVYAHMANVQKPLAEIRHDIPLALSQIIDKLMSKNAEERYQSALGLKHDLHKCQELLESHPQVAPMKRSFDLGLQDVSDRFNIPEVLYGRESEVQTLLQHFYTAASGKAQLLAIAGYSGIGKSALVHEVHKPIAAESGLFLQGKFDQFQKNVPYSALKRAMSGWVQYALSLSEEKLGALREDVINRLGANARLLVDFMSDFGRVIYRDKIGDLPPLPEVGPQENQNRFFLVMQRFIRLVSQHRPLVIFVDDLQWADRGTLNLLPKLLGEDGCRLLVIVAYRDNEVDATHPALQMLENIEQQSSKSDKPIACTITLGPLPSREIQHLLEDALHRRDKEVDLLCKKILEKTAGNPLFSIEFLKTLYTEKLLNFNLDTRQWTWDIDAIEAQAITDNVVELMLAKMKNLPLDTQAVLQVAACVGTYFDIEALSIISEKDMPDVARALWPALKEGLLIQEGGDWFMGMLGLNSQVSTSTSESAKNQTSSETSTDTERRRSPWIPRCKFLHDRMLQAAYESLNEEQRKAAHLKNGRLFLLNYDESQLNKHLFSILEQLNYGRELITDSEEKVQLAQLNLKAAEFAKNSSAWSASARHCEIGLDLLQQRTNTPSNLGFELRFLLMESEFLLVNVDRGLELAEELLSDNTNSLEKAKVCLVIACQIVAIDFRRCIDAAILGLRHCGLNIPESNQVDAESVEQERAALQALLTAKQNEPSSSDHQKTVPEPISLAYRIFAQLTGCSQVGGMQELFFYSVYKGLRTVLEYGENEHSIILHSMFGCACTKLGRYQEANNTANTLFALLDNYPRCAEYPYINMSVGTFIWHYCNPIQEAVDLQLKAYETGDEYGDIYRGTLAGYGNALISEYAQGKRLKLLIPKAERLGALVSKFKVRVLAANYYIRLFRMLSESDSVNWLSASSFNKSEWEMIQSCVLKPFLEHLLTQYLFWSNQFDEAYKTVTAAEHSLPLLSGFISALEQRFMAALLSCKRYSDNKSSYFIQRSLAELEELNSYCPENFQHKLMLLQAEIGLAEKMPAEELRALYEGAIKSARDHGFLQYEALGNELLWQMYVEKGFGNIAIGYLENALGLYQRWGCSVKVIALENRYKEYLKCQDSGTGEQVNARGQTNQSINSSLTSESRASSLNASFEGLDVSSVMKSAQVISGELELKSLLAKVIEVIVENTGAQHAVFITQHDKGARVESRLQYQDGKAVVCLESRLLDEQSDLPVTLIQYVLRSEQTLHLDENFQAVQENHLEQQNAPVFDDPYFSMHHPKSLLSVPVKYRDQTIGALYLENTLSTNAFPPDRLKVVNMLLAQAAIAYENARLFNEVNELNTGLEVKVQQRTAELEQANAELEAFAGSVSHDLRAPLRKIRSFTQIIMEDHQEEMNDDMIMLMERVLRGTEKMGELVTGLMDLSRMREIDIVQEVVCISDMVNELYEEMRDRFPDQSVEANLLEGCYVKADARMLRSVMENLINNAWKYSSKTQNAKISFGKLAPGEAIPQGIGTIPSVLPKHRAIFYLKDTGAGFDMKYANELFGTFKRLHNPGDFDGTGIGLATVKRAIEKHGGSIWAYSKEGKGASFYFTFEEA